MGLDVGASCTRCVILKSFAGKPVVFGIGAAAASGWSKSEIADVHAVMKSCDSAILRAGVSREFISVAAIGVGHPLARTKLSDVAHDEAQAEKDDVTIFVSRDQPMEKGPAPSRVVGTVTIPRFAFKGYDAISSNIGAGRTIFLFEPTAASSSILGSEDRARGSFVLDIGFESTGCVLWKDSLVNMAFGIPFGTIQVARNIAYQEQISLAAAIDLQTHAVRGDDTRQAGPKLNLFTLKEHSRYFAASVVQSLSDKGIQLQDLPPRIILTGGGSRMYGLDLWLEDMLSREVLFGSPAIFSGSDEEGNDADWCTACGLALEAFAARYDGGGFSGDLYGMGDGWQPWDPPSRVQPPVPN